jgi:hypothetical protein
MRKRHVADRAAAKDVSGDVVVIAAGRQNAIAKWFAELGLEQPQVTTVDAHIGYASRMYRRASRTAQGMEGHHRSSSTTRYPSERSNVSGRE